MLDLESRAPISFLPSFSLFLPWSSSKSTVGVEEVRNTSETMHAASNFFSRSVRRDFFFHSHVICETRRWDMAYIQKVPRAFLFPVRFLEEPFSRSLLDMTYRPLYAVSLQSLSEIKKNSSLPQSAFVVSNPNFSSEERNGGISGAMFSGKTRMQIS